MTAIARTGLAAGLVVVLAGCGSSSWKTVGKGPAVGGNYSTTVSAGATVKQPSLVQLRIEAKPDVVTRGAYTAYCDNGSQGGKSVVKEFPIHTPTTVDVNLPSGYRTCTISATTTLSSPSKMTISIRSRSA